MCGSENNTELLVTSRIDIDTLIDIDVVRFCVNYEKVAIALQAFMVSYHIINCTAVSLVV